MVYSTQKGIILFTFLAVLCVSGCDLLAPKSKKPVAPVKVSAPVEVPVAAAPAPVEPAADEKLPKDVLVSVGDWTLTVADFDERVKNIKQAVPTFDEKDIKSKNMLIEELIRQQLMVYEAREQRLNETKDFQAAVKDFENNILLQELVVNLTRDIKATDAEVKEYYDKNPDVFMKPVEKKVSEIVVPTEAEAREILVLVLQGGDFTQLAKDRSKGKSAANGGNLGFLAKLPFEQMGKAIETLGKGGVSSVVKGPEGYYILKVDDIRGGDKVSFDEVKADLMKGLTAQKQQQVVLDKMAEVAKKVKIKVNTDLLNIKPGE